MKIFIKIVTKGCITVTDMNTNKAK